ncbi:rod shape-determining protein MreD [Orbus hercynius]|uniref:Rod shape-determining protein MreD n=1 Tax=Orbus hercynius TaxID=593135 RepID=A0A495REX3_9GAMM|nr:rod shape-determining protein MreD [Orbus hercynius]RKS85931.1 rod shape-determining protein MreD [Orbus hercynius]
MNKFSHNYWMIWVTLFIGLLLQIMPWTSSFYMLKPHWLMLITMYWVLALPHRVGIWTAFLVGIILDLFSGTVLGVHAFIFALIAYLILFRFQLVRNLALWQQSFIIFGLSCCYDLMLFIFEILIYQMITISPLIFLSAFIDAVIWTWLFLLLRQIRRAFAID